MQKTLGLLLVAAAAYGAYKFNKMTPDQKNALREKGKDFLDKKMGLGKMMSRRSPAAIS